ncbi:hypothetical protein PCANC_11515 [Puccinia coronata f. sp. avenae]|uniref:Uncharacterized protein n=1 Tax=Puccinia coronata f. sp. avenae TaxID=200324 RepID=A0A2N5UVK5_9BASI|nr:hypothetical protein PCANC_11515 [Puccinia coronata f. sp. avenae]
MGAHLRNGKDISREEKQCAEIARQLTLARQHQPLQRRGDNGSPFTTGHGDSSLPSQLPGGFPSARIDPLDPSTRSNRETRSVESPFVENSSNQPALSLLQANATPQGQTQALEMSEEAETAANILNGQWSLFLKAHSSNDTSLMQTTLTQAHSTQLLLQRLVGFDDMMRLSDNWSAKKELDKLEAEMNAPKKSGPAPMILDKELSKGTPQDDPNIPGKKPEIKYLKLVPGGFQTSKVLIFQT